MIRKHRGDYVRHFFSNIYDSTILNSVDPNVFLSDLNLDSYTLLTTKNDPNYYVPFRKRVWANPFFKKSNDEDFSNQYAPVGNMPYELQSGFTQGGLPGIFNSATDIDSYVMIDAHGYYIKDDYYDQLKMSINHNIQSSAPSGLSYNTIPDEDKHVVIKVKRLKDAYDFSKISNIKNLLGNTLSLQELKQFENYLVPVNVDDNNYEDGEYLRFCFETPINEYLVMGSQMFQLFPFIFNTEYYQAYLDGGVVVPILGNNIPKLSTYGDGSKSFIQNYDDGVKYLGIFDIAQTLFYCESTNFSIIFQNYFDKYNDKIRYMICSNAFNYQDSMNWIGIEDDNLYPVFDILINTDLYTHDYYGTQLSRSIPSQYGRYGLTPITTYYEDIDVLRRSFTFDYNDNGTRKLSIISYNQEELENYLTEWGLTWEYYNDWVGPIEPTYEGRKIRHILLGKSSEINSEKIRHVIGYQHSVIPSQKIRHIIGGM